jgi:hypothetical protein
MIFYDATFVVMAVTGRVICKLVKNAGNLFCNVTMMGLVLEGPVGSANIRTEAIIY